MEYNPGADWLTEAAKAAERQGPGNLLRIVLIVMVVGCVLVGWFLLRGYRQSSDSGSVRGVDRMPERPAGKDAERTPGKGTERTPDKSTGIAPDKSTGSAPGKGTGSAPGKGTGSAPGESPGESAESAPDKGADSRNG
ncbi:hypothetical protein [Streptomyces sp. NPDC058308]|uniref:hypothetical protein n=1 Tax=Streptomyces sp. NPDC058308 TaxID=3346440 RepID=UPI0036F0EAAF